MTDILNEPAKKPFRGLFAVGLTCLLCWGFAALSISYFQDYMLGLFIWLPMVLGAASTVLYGYRHVSSKRKLFGISFYTLLVYCFGLLAFAWEGVICLIMAFPIGLFFTYVGRWIGYEILKSKMGNSTITPVVLFVSVPMVMAFENANAIGEQVRPIVTSVEINATPEEVWENVIAFPQLKEPDEFIFKAGIAYPINATIQGEGVGAVRHCNFSTGSFVEPITVWDKPRLLKFSVVEQPASMKELSFYDIEPNHLHGYWVSKEGQFKLIGLPNGKTRLEGTTWYINKIKPNFYWSIWSDYIVHKIHQRVLNHIKEEVEKKH